MTHSLKYIGITRDALIDAAKYDPPSAEIVTALVEALISEADDAAALEIEVDALTDQVDKLNNDIWFLKQDVEDLEDKIETNQETESND
jgi:hypothetical protein